MDVDNFAQISLPTMLPSLLRNTGKLPIAYLYQ